MPELKLKEAEGFSAWATMLVRNRETWWVPEANARMDFFGDGDARYLVLELALAQTSILEYVFLPQDDAQSGQTVAMIFDLLRSQKYSLQQLLVWLSWAEFVDEEIGWRVYTHGLSITRTRREIPIEQTMR